VLLIAVPHARQRLCVQGRVGCEGVVGGSLVSASSRVTEVSGSPLTVLTTTLLSAAKVQSFGAAGAMVVRGSCSSCHCLRSRVHRFPLTAACIMWNQAMLSLHRVSERTLGGRRLMWHTLLPERCSGRPRRW
jgi:hypothetical protein